MSSHFQFDAQCGGRKPADVRLEQREGGDLQQLMHSNPPNSSGICIIVQRLHHQSSPIVFLAIISWENTLFPQHSSSFSHIAHLSYLCSLRFPCFSVAGLFYSLIYHNRNVKCQYTKVDAFIFMTNLH